MILLFSLFSDRSSSDWRESLIPGYLISLLLITRLKRVTDKFENQFIYLDNMYSFQLAFLIETFMITKARVPLIQSLR